MTNAARKNVLIMAGGTGGHIIPALAVADALIASGAKVAWLGRTEGLEADWLTSKPEITYYPMTIKPLKAKSWWRKAQMLWVFISAIWHGWRLLRQIKPDVVCGFGGYVSAPGGIAAWCLRIPLVIHEQNKVAGMANRYLSFLASHVCESFPKTFKASPRVTCTGNPIRARITELPGPEQRRHERTDQDLRIAVLGGSQGARSLNEIVPLALAALGAMHPIAVWHQTGTLMLKEVQNKYHEFNVPSTVSAFIEDMPSLYGWADIVIARSGATTVAEIAAVGIASILIPYPYSADDHQRANAMVLVDQGAAIVCEEARLSPESLVSDIQGLLKRNDFLSMAMAAKRVSQPDATQRVALIILGMHHHA